MKSLLIILSFLFSLPTIAAVEMGSVEIEAELEYAIVDAKVACITKWHPASEGEEEAELYFVSNYREKRELNDKGFYNLNTLKGGIECGHFVNGPMKHVDVGMFDKNADILKAIEKADAAIQAKVVFTKYDSQKTNREIRKIIEDLVR